MHKLRLAIPALLILLACQSAALADPIPITVEPNDQTVELGSTVTIDIVIDPAGAEIIAVFDMIVNWDPTLLSLTSVVFGSALGGFADSFQDFIDGLGFVNVSEVSLLFDFDGFQDGSAFTLFTLEFDTLGIGTSDFLLVGNIFGQDDPFNFVGDFFGDPLEVAAGTGSVTIVAAVPEPGTLVLFLTGLLALGWQLKRQRKHRQISIG